MERRSFTRRDFLKRSSTTATSRLLAACAAVVPRGLRNHQVVWNEKLGTATALSP